MENRQNNTKLIEMKSEAKRTLKNNKWKTRYHFCNEPILWIWNQFISNYFKLKLKKQKKIKNKIFSNLVTQLKSTNSYKKIRFSTFQISRFSDFQVFRFFLLASFLNETCSQWLKCCIVVQSNFIPDVIWNEI